ncbi:MAG: hypothetical protein Q8P07_04150 [bacterium]|nr:hypothetical protein [bacterium]
MAQKEYKEILRRQNKLEASLEALRKVIDSEYDEDRIKPSALKKWDKISRDMDRGKVGRTFTSAQEMRKWLKSL